MPSGHCQQSFVHFSKKHKIVSITITTANTASITNPMHAARINIYVCSLIAVLSSNASSRKLSLCQYSQSDFGVLTQSTVSLSGHDSTMLVCLPLRSAECCDVETLALLHLFLILLNEIIK